MNKLIFLGLLLFTITATSQTVKIKQAIATSYSILKASIGDSLFRYFSLSEGSYYTYMDNRLHRKMTGKFLNKKNIPKSFFTLNFLYLFDYPKVKGVKDGLWLKLGKDFKLVDTLDFAFIPQFLKENRKPDFISIDTALFIAKNNFKQKGFEITIEDLAYNSKLKVYSYSVFNKLTKTLNNAGKDTGEMEIIEINALTGKVELIDKGYYGLIIR